MRAHVLAIAVLLSGAGPALAEPAKSDAAKPAQPAQRPAQLALASADPVKAPASQASEISPAPAKRKIAPRVTTCRCGDPQVASDSQDQ